VNAPITRVSVALLERELAALNELNEARHIPDRYLVNGLRLWLEEVLGKLKRGPLVCQPIPPRGDGKPVKGGRHGK
jgi:hypothetical protein